MRHLGKENTGILPQPHRHHCMVKECGFGAVDFFFIENEKLSSKLGKT